MVDRVDEDRFYLKVLFSEMDRAKSGIDWKLLIIRERRRDFQLI